MKLAQTVSQRDGSRSVKTLFELTLSIDMESSIIHLHIRGQPSCESHSGAPTRVNTNHGPDLRSFLIITRWKRPRHVAATRIVMIHDRTTDPGVASGQLTMSNFQKESAGWWTLTYRRFPTSHAACCDRTIPTCKTDVWRRTHHLAFHYTIAPKSQDRRPAG